MPPTILLLVQGSQPFLGLPTLCSIVFGSCWEARSLCPGSYATHCSGQPSCLLTPDSTSFLGYTILVSRRLLLGSPLAMSRVPRSCETFISGARGFGRTLSRFRQIPVPGAQQVSFSRRVTKAHVTCEISCYNTCLKITSIIDFHFHNNFAFPKPLSHVSG